MIVVPQFDSLAVDGYGLFPGKDNDGHIDIDFTGGLTVLAGINGLGKTTLLTLLLRMITGPFDLTKTGPPSSYTSALPSKPRKLKRGSTDFFAQRVSDGATSATATLTLYFNRKKVIIRRGLSGLELLELKSSRHKKVDFAKDRDEQQYQEAIAGLFGVSSFIDVLLLLHNVLFFDEGRTSALWDANGQRHLLGVMVLDKTLSQNFSSLTRALQKADSNYRNTKYALNGAKKQLTELETKTGTSPDVAARYESTVTSLSTLRDGMEHLEAQLSEAEERFRTCRLEREKTKQDHEAAYRAVERAKYTSLVNLFPTMEDASRLLFARILSEAECLICGAEAKDKQQELLKQLSDGFCPACGSESSSDAGDADRETLDKARLARAKKKAVQADQALKKANDDFDDAAKRRRLRLVSLQKAREDVVNLEASAETLGVLRAPDTDEIQSLRTTVKVLTKKAKSEHATYALEKDKYTTLLVSVRERIGAVSQQLSDAFSKYIKGLLSESAALTASAGQAIIGQQTSSSFDFPVFVTEMSAAAIAGDRRRSDQDDVSESQRELIDLAFRLSLLDVISQKSGATFIMETPEASLDGLAMNRVGGTLHDFWNKAGHRLIITNNLTNTGLVSALFGGAAGSKSERKARFNNVFNLLDEAAPNRALEENRPAYERLLEQAILGT